MADTALQITAVSSEDAQKAAFTVLDILQGVNPPGVRVVSVAFMLLMICRRFRLDPRDVLDKTDRMIRDSLSKGRGEYVRAIREYLREEV